MAAVYEGRHRNGARAAIKYFSLSVSASREICQRFLREGYLANKIEHPGVVRVLDDHIDVEQEHAYLVMELLDGESLQEHVDRCGVIPPRRACEIVIELCGCLEVAHEKGVIHRDIKPDNLFLDKSGLKVLDFGIARALDASQGVLTRTGSALGTPAYMAPEQALGKNRELSPRSDIYSVGATLLYLVSGELLHEAESAQEMMVRAAWTPAEKVRDRLPNVPAELADVIDQACAYEAEQRFSSAAELRAALEEILERLPTHPIGVLAGRAQISSATTLQAAESPPLSASAKAVTPKESPGAGGTADFVHAPRSGRRWLVLIAGLALLALAAAWYGARTSSAGTAGAAPSASPPRTAPSATSITGASPAASEPEVVPQPPGSASETPGALSSADAPGAKPVAAARPKPPALIKEPADLLKAVPAPAASSATNPSGTSAKPPATPAANAGGKERDLGY